MLVLLQLEMSCRKENLYKTWHHQCSGKDNTDIITLFRTIFGKDPSNHMQHHSNLLRVIRCFMVISSIHPAWQRPGMPGLAGSMFNFCRTAGREDSRVDKEREVLKKVNPKWGNRWQQATSRERFQDVSGLESCCFFPNLKKRGPVRPLLLKLQPLGCDEAP